MELGSYFLTSRECLKDPSSENIFEANIISLVENKTGQKGGSKYHDKYLVLL